MTGRLTLTRRELLALSSAGAHARDLHPAREKVVAFLANTRGAQDYVLDTRRCTCPRGFGTEPSLDCHIHRTQ